MSESFMRQKVVKDLRYLHAVAIENSAYPGTPDVNYVEGWLELKWVDRWPARGGILRLPHFTPQQRIWLRRRNLMGGKAHVLLWVEENLILLNGIVAAEYLGNANNTVLWSVAQRTWVGWPLKGELKEELQK